ncbi:GerAB/ArcD/ProY family transporter [Caminicella sporogenes]|uniref:GerAB/ArcD/ProY family transporter n=1 Tax=Caminicella sporogenes TaxID=166485 RepID=UPI002540D182|nr:endospore germination permease [Caminicella sporogenes]WIF95761.1 endospore germination permease [Caminicella sporogenes]
MNKEVISNKQGIALITLFIMGSSLILGTGTSAGRDAWIAEIISILFAVPIVCVYARILYLFPQKDLVEIVEIIFGKFIGKIIALLFIWFSFHLGALVLRNFGEFITNVSLPETPIIVSMLFMIIVCIWGVKEGIEVLGRWSNLNLMILFILITVTIILLVPNMKIDNILPILSRGFKPVFKGAFSVFSFPFAETVVFLLFFSSIDNESSYKIYLTGLILGGIIIFATSFSELLVFGEKEYVSFLFPSYKAVGRIKISDFIQSLEIIVSISFLVGGFIKISMCLLASCKGITKLFGFNDYRFIVVPMSLLMINLSYLIYDSTNEMFKWAFEIYGFYALPFQVILPIFILICAEFKKRKKDYIININITK